MACLYLDGYLLLQAILYLAIFAAGLASSIASGLAKSQFGGFCPLYGTAGCSIEQLNQTYINCTFVAGRSSVCVFITMSTVLACVLYALGCFGYLTYLVNRSRVMIRVAEQMWLRLLLFGTILAFLLTIAVAGTVTMGFSQWCSSFPDINDITCVRSQSSQWAWHTDTGVAVSPGSYYDSFTVTESSCWINVLFWLVHLLLYSYRLFKVRKQQQRNAYHDAFTFDDTFDSFT